MAKVSNLKVAIQGGTISTLYATWTFNETTSTSSSTNRKVKVGDIVLYAKYAGTDIKIDGTEYKILSVKDALGILE